MFHSRKISFVIVVFSVSDSSGIDGDMFDGDSSKGICDMDFPVVRLDYGRIREFAVTTFQGKGRVPVFAVPGNGNPRSQHRRVRAPIESIGSGRR